MNSRAKIAGAMALLFTIFVAFSSFLDCPFLNRSDSAHASMPCCPRESSPSQECPLSDALQTCPFYVTESKIGVAEGKVVIAGITPSVDPLTDTLLAEFDKPALAGSVRDPGKTDIYLVNRVLRI